MWDAQSVYLKVSPFFFAEKIKTPLLIIHGDDDANPGTTPLQARKLFEAIRGNGGTTRLVMLPHEPHWYSAMESQRAAHLRDGPLVRQVREERAAARGAQGQARAGEVTPSLTGRRGSRR